MIPPMNQPIIAEGGLFSVPWRKFVNWLAPQTGVQAAVTVGATPWTYTNGDHFTGLTVSGGTVTKIEYSTTGNPVDTGVTAGLFTLMPGDQLTLTFSVDPTVTECYRVNPR